MGVLAPERRTQPKPQSRHLRQPSRGRRTMAAGHVIVVAIVALLLWTLLDAHGLKRSAEASQIGARRSAALFVLGPIDGISRVLGLRQLGGLIEKGLGRDPNALPGGGVSLPPGAGQLPPGTGVPRTAVSPAPTGPSSLQASGWRPPREPTTDKLSPLRKPTKKNPLRVLVVGDSFAGDFGFGLERTVDTDLVRIVNEGLQSTSLSRPDYYNWPAALAQDVSTFHPELVFAIFGANDPYTGLVQYNGGILGFGDTGYFGAYRKRVDLIVNEATAGGARLVWIGLPVMQNDTVSRDVRQLDGIFRAEAAKNRNALYIDSWSMFTDQNGNYAAYLKGPNGNYRLVRGSDGVHLSPDGNDQLASAVVRRLRQEWRFRD